MKTHIGMEVNLYAFLSSALAGGEISASSSSHFIPDKRDSAPNRYEAAWVPEPVRA
jgi:hypothetical protein